MPATTPTLRRRLLAWFDQAQRPMPWRALHPARTDPYFVLVSEAMLQQTQVVTVIPYFVRFIAAFPTVEALAAADEQQVLRLWQGLGYYRRAKNLHKTAQAVVRDFGGRLPDTAEKLQTLPGIGPYTAGAIASIAFGENAPLVDGNVIRVLSRLFGLDEAADSPTVKKAIWALAGEFAKDARPGCVNQALMELGALVCTPKNTKCDQCPLAKDCAAKAAGMVELLPVLKPRKKPVEVVHRVVAAGRSGKLLFVKRPETGLWAGMWQLPTLEDAGDLAAWFKTEYGLALAPLEKIGAFKHQTTHRTIRFEVWQAQVEGGRLRQGAGEWRAMDEVDDLPLAKAQGKALELLGKLGKSRAKGP